MNLATVITQAPAVRKHGGGRTSRYLLTLLLIGRPARLPGGEINRRGEAATYPNHFPTSCAAAAYPKTGVRRARKSSIPLRSTTRPHAQLVEGYKRPYLNLEPDLTSMVRALVEDLFSSRFISSNLGITLMAWDAGRRLQSEDSRREQHSYLKAITNTIKVQVVIKVPIQTSEHDLKNICCFGIYVLDTWLVSTQDDLTQYLIYFQGKKSKPASMTCCALTLLSLTFLHSNIMLVIGNHHRSYDCCNRAYGLNPRWSAFSPPRQVEEPNSNQYAERGDEQEPRAEFEVNFNFIRQHEHFLLTPSQASLKAPCHHVQRGEA